MKAWLPHVCVCEPVKLYNNQSSFERKRKAVDGRCGEGIPV